MKTSKNIFPAIAITLYIMAFVMAFYSMFMGWLLLISSILSLVIGVLEYIKQECDKYNNS